MNAIGDIIKNAQHGHQGHPELPYSSREATTQQASMLGERPREKAYRPGLQLAIYLGRRSDYTLTSCAERIEFRMTLWMGGDSQEVLGPR